MTACVDNKIHHTRDGCCQPPPAQIRTWSITSYGSSVRSNDRGNSATSRDCRATPIDARSGAESGTSTAIRQLFPSVTSFPRRTPLLRSQFCSPVSIVLRSHLNSQQRSCQHCPRRGSLAAQGVIRHAALHLRLMGPSRPVFKRTQARLECLRMHRVFDSAVFVDALP